jgi:hypothetical protein
VVAKLEDMPSNSLQWEGEKNKKDVTNRNRQSQISDTFSFGKCSGNGRFVSLHNVHRKNADICLCFLDYDCKGK